MQLTGHEVNACRFSVLRDDPVHGWLGASPDGLIDALTATPGAPSLELKGLLLTNIVLIGSLKVLLEHTSEAAGAAAGTGVQAAEGPGVLEIKCPFNRGKPKLGKPPAQPPWYYMPQVLLTSRLANPAFQSGYMQR